MRQLKITQSITSRESLSVTKYMNDVTKESDLITPEEEVELAIKIRSGDEKALSKLVKANLRFVISVAKQYQNSGMDFGDLINEGNVGLIKAAKKFDETRGLKFISYAVWWIRQSIMEALANHSRMVRLPLNKVGLASKFHTTQNKLEQELGRVPQQEEVLEKMNLTSKDMKDVFPCMVKHSSIDMPIGEDNNGAYSDLLQDDYLPNPDGLLVCESLRNDIERAFRRLSDREKDIVKMYYGIGHETSFTLDEIGMKFELTRERVRQIKEKSLRILKGEKKGTSLLRKYL